MLILALALLVACGKNESKNNLKNSISESVSLSQKSSYKSINSTNSSKNPESLNSLSVSESLNSLSISESIEISIDNSENEKKERVLGVWWWKKSLGEEYLDFVATRGVNEIYYCSSEFSVNTASFIQKAKEKNIRVYWLGGEYGWAQDSTNLYTKINKYLAYQQEFPNSQFSGVHLDIEPHQNPSWKGTDKESPVRVTLIQELIDVAIKVKTDFPDIEFSFDLPFWLDYEITYNGEKRLAYEAMIDICDRVFLMSYRDTADGIYSVSSEEINYAKSVNKSVFMGIETYSTEGDNVSFWEEGESVMLSEMALLKSMVDESFGLAVHHAERWYEMANLNS